MIKMVGGLFFFGETLTLITLGPSSDYEITVIALGS